MPLMRISMAVFLLLLSSCFPHRSQSDRKIPLVVYHYESTQVAHGLTESSENGIFIISGWTSAGNGVPPNCLMMKVDREGNLLERRIYDNLQWHCGFIVRSPEDGGYFVDDGAYLAKLDDNLDYRWKKIFRSFTYTHIVDQFARVDSGRYVYALAKGTYVEVVFLDAQGNVLKTVDFNYKDGVLCFSSVVEALDDGSVMVAAQYQDTTTDTSGIFLAKLNPQMDTIWTKVVDVRSIYGYPVANVISLLHLDDGSLVAGVNIERGFMNGFAALLKLDEQGNVVADYDFDENGDAISIISSMARLSVGGFVMSANMLRSSNGTFYTVFARFDDNLNVVWRRDFPGYEWGSSITYGQAIETSDGDIAFAGYFAVMDDIAFMMLDRETGEPLIWSNPDW